MHVCICIYIYTFRTEDSCGRSQMTEWDGLFAFDIGLF